MFNLLRKNESSGFTLLELMMSMVIMAIAFLGILPFFFYSQAQLKQATIMNAAITCIQNIMERVLFLDYDLITYDDFDGTPTQFVYVLPEANLQPCSTLPAGSCGFIPSLNMLRDYVQAGSYFFTRVIDIDDPDDPNSLESNDLRPGGNDLPPDGITKRITVKVSWTIPGGGERYVMATTQKVNIPPSEVF
jgi:prepilin-type N-terminal cleavage/methylation domain-containing protein